MKGKKKIIKYKNLFIPINDPPIMILLQDLKNCRLASKVSIVAKF